MYRLCIGSKVELKNRVLMDYNHSGTLPDKNDSELLLRRTIVALMEFALSTMSPIWILSTMSNSGYKRSIDMLPRA